MKPGSLIFVRGSGWIARVIRWVTKSQYSHVSIYVGDGKVMEAQAFRKVGLQELSFYAGDYDLKSVPVTDIQMLHGMMWLLYQRGRHYSYWSDFVILVRKLFGIVIPWKEDKEIMCSRLARDFLFACGLPIPDENMCPEDLHIWVTQYEAVKANV